MEICDPKSLRYPLNKWRGSVSVRIAAQRRRKMKDDGYTSRLIVRQPSGLMSMAFSSMTIITANTNDPHDMMSCHS